MVAVLALCAPSTALAGAYTVKGCAASSAVAESGWTPQVRPGEPIDASNFCQTSGGGTDGNINFAGTAVLRAQRPLPFGVTSAGSGRVAGLTLTAPAGTSLTHITYKRRLVSTDPAWTVQLSADGALIDDCTSPALGTNCPDTSAASGGILSRDLAPGTATLDLAATCVVAVCPYTGSGAYNFGVAIASSSVTVQDDTPPTVAAVTTSTPSAGWLGSGSQLTFSGNDSTGLQHLQLVDETGAVVTDVVDPQCVDWSPTPCAEPSLGGKPTVSRSVGADELELKDGAHTVHARATDAAGNVTNGPALPINLDTTAPEAGDLHGGGFSQDEYRQLTWSVPSGGSPVVSARVEVCRMDDDESVANDRTRNGCQKYDAPPAGPFTVDLPGVSSAAEVRVALTDAAGNTSSGEDDEEDFYRDAVAPAQPTVSAYGGGGNARTFLVTAKGYDATTLHVRLCQGTVCIAQPDVPWQSASQIVKVSVPSVGDWRLEVTLSDDAGNVSPVGSTTFTYSATVANVGNGLTNQKDASGNSNQPVLLVPVVPAKLSGSTILIRGTVKAGSTAQVSVAIAGRLKNGKTTGTAKSVKPGPDGKFAVRLRIASKLNRKTGVLLTIVAQPNPGYVPSTVRKRLRG